MLSGNSLRQTVHTHRASVLQAAKLLKALLRVAWVTAGLEESNGNLPPGLWLTSPTGWLPRTGIRSRTLRYLTFTFNFQSSTAKTPTPTLAQFLTDKRTSAQKEIHNSSNNLAFLFIAGSHFSYGDFSRSVSAKLHWWGYFLFLANK